MSQLSIFRYLRIHKNLFIGFLLIALPLCGTLYLWSMDAKTMILPTDNLELTVFEWSRGIATRLGELIIMLGAVMIFLHLKHLRQQKANQPK